MIGAVFLFIVALAVGVYMLYLAFDKRARRDTARQHWLWSKAKNEEEQEFVEGIATLGPLIGGVIILSLAFVLMVTFIATRFVR